MNQKLFIFPLLFGLLICLPPNIVFASFAGHNTRGDYGLQSGSQPAPGFYAIAPMFYRYDADTLRDSSGNAISPDPVDRGSVTANAYIFGLLWVSEHKIFGGNYSFQIYPGFTNNALEAPLFALNDGVSTGLADLYFQPINLGWHTDHADFTTGIGVYAPTGEYELGGSDNRGLGMWTLEFFAGSTVYFDESKSWHAATTAFYETHSDKDGTDIRVGDILTLEGGLGKSFMDGAISVGASYYAQWKITKTRLVKTDEHSVIGVMESTACTVLVLSCHYHSQPVKNSMEFSTQGTFGSLMRKAHSRAKHSY